MVKTINSRTLCFAKPLSLLAFLWLIATAYAGTPANIIGAFQAEVPTANKADTRVIEVKVEKSEGKLSLSGSAAFSSGRSAAPNFSGEFLAQKGSAYRFSFEDSFENKGEATVTANDAGVTFSVTLTEVKDPRCQALYGKIQLKREKK